MKLKNFIEFFAHRSHCMLVSVCLPLFLLAQLLYSFTANGQHIINCPETPFSFIRPWDFQVHELEEVFSHHQTVSGLLMAQTAEWSPLVKFMTDKFKSTMEEISETESPAPELKKRALFELDQLIGLTQLGQEFGRNSKYHTSFINWSLKLLADGRLPPILNLKKASKEMRKEVLKIYRDWKEDSKQKIKKVERDSDYSLSPYLSEIKLHGNEARTQEWVQRQAKVNKWGNSLNNVILINDGAQKRIAVFKSGRNQATSQASAVLEKITWDISAKLGHHLYFSPTRLTEIQLKADNKVIKGGLQNFQDFVPYSRYFDYHYSEEDLPPLSTNEFLQGLFLNLIYGAFDAHGNNIGIRPSGRPIFFDNARSFPHSNDFILWGGKVQVPFRSAFLKSSKAQKQLTTKHRDFLLMQLALTRKHLPLLRGYLKGREFQELQKMLPENWWDSDLVLQGLLQRIDRMEKALNDQEVRNMIDVTFQVFPEYRFVYALRLATYDGQFDYDDPYKFQGYLYWPMVPVEKLLYEFTSDITKLISKAQAQGIDVSKIYQMAHDKDLSLKGLQKAIEKTYFPKSFPNILKKATPEIINSNEEFLRKIKSERALKDNKDT